MEPRVDKCHPLCSTRPGLSSAFGNLERLINRAITGVDVKSQLFEKALKEYTVTTVKPGALSFMGLVLAAPNLKRATLETNSTFFKNDSGDTQKRL